MAAIIARKPAYLTWIKHALSAARVKDYMRHVFDGREGEVAIYDVPGIYAVNLLFSGALQGGQLASPRLDALAKGIGQQLLDLEVEVPASLDVMTHAQRRAAAAAAG